MAEEDLNCGDQQINNKSDQNSVLQNGFHEEPDFSDPEDFVDDITDEGKADPLKPLKRWLSIYEWPYQWIVHENGIDIDDGTVMRPPDSVVTYNWSIRCSLSRLEINADISGDDRAERRRRSTCSLLSSIPSSFISDD